MSKHINKHVYGGASNRESHNNVFLKKSMVGADGAPVKLDKIGSLERRRN